MNDDINSLGVHSTVPREYEFKYPKNRLDKSNNILLDMCPCNMSYLTIY